ncbi:MAG TPA: hypothetical protein VHV30_08780 [Polyangiaceae bacterium]|nr:hypothetical protein [Polyangiaceae bacterium]
MTSLSPILPWRRRVPHVASVVYVAVLAITVDQGIGGRTWFLATLGVVLGVLGARRTSRIGRAAGWGLAVVVASLGATRASHGLDACRGVGVFASGAAASWSIARIGSQGGLVGAPRVYSPVFGIALLGVIWWGALVALLAPDRSSTAWLVENPRGWEWGAIAATTALLFAWTEWTVRVRELELGVMERATATRGLLWALLIAVTLVGVTGRAESLAMASLALALAGTMVTAAGLTPDAVRVGRASRRVVVLGLVGGGAAFLGASIAAGGYAEDVWFVTLATGLVGLAIGSAIEALEGPVRPAGGAWLDAFARAGEEALRADPQEAIQHALLALRGPAGAGAQSPELWTFAPTGITTVDAAGYVHHREAELPETLLLVASGEPEATLRAEVLDALEVRRPDIRPLAQWMDDHAAALATVVASDGETEGVLVLPRGQRSEPVTLEEVCAFKRVADRLALACRSRGTQARMLDRAQASGQQAAAAEDRIEALLHARDLGAERDALATSRLARPATVGVYSAASRGVLEALERRTAVSAPIVVVAPSGADPVPYIARAHLAGGRAKAPLVLVDATSVREHDPARWTDPTRSPIALADGGLLVLLDGAALPADIQRLVARACAERRAPWDRPDPLDLQIALTTVPPPAALLAEERLDPSLAQRLGEAVTDPVFLPRLRDRPEDLRAILTDRLAREGLRVRGRPVGIDHAAYARLVDYEFPGEDVELMAIAQRLVASLGEGDVVRKGDVEALALPAAAPASTPSIAG